MKAYIQNNWTNTSQNYQTAPALAFYMSGAVPTDKASLLAALPAVDVPTLLEKCVGVGLMLCTRYKDANLKVRGQYKVFSDKLSMLKRGSAPFNVNATSYHYPMPSKAYREDGKSGLWWMPPTLFAFPIARTNVYGATISPAIRKPNVRVKELETDVGAEASYVVEYADATTISALFTGACESRGGVEPTSVRVDYWSGTSWHTAWTGQYDQETAKTFTAVTSTKFRLVLGLSQSATSVVTRLGGLALLHTASKAPIALSNSISWLAILPMPDIALSMSNPLYLNERLLPYTEAETRLNSTLCEAGAMDLLSSMAPIIIDTCGTSAMTAKALISKSTGLIATTDRPTVTMYDYILGDLG